MLDVSDVFVLAQIPSQFTVKHTESLSPCRKSYLCIIIFIRKYLTLLDISWMLLVTILLMPARMRTQCHTQRMAKTCSKAW